MAKRRTHQTTTESARLPSESEILRYIQSASGRIGKREIARAFDVTGGDRIELKRMLREMRDKGLIAKDGRRLRDAASLPPVAVLEITGTDEDGELKARPVNREPDSQDAAFDIVVLAKTLRGTRDRQPAAGDRILAKLTRVRGNGADAAYEARIIRVLSSPGRTVLGVFRKSRDAGMRIEPINRRDRGEMHVLEGDDLDAVPGELVEAELVRDRGRGLAQARVRERLGPVGDETSYSLIAMHEHGLPYRFSDEALAEADRLGEAGLQDRTDLRDVPLITIDPADARDHDDAVWAEADDDPDNAGGFRVMVAIADVAWYVRPGTALDHEARERGNSVYFPDRVIPMLPERISTDLCSLRPGEDRPTLAVLMTFDRHGRKRKHEFMRGCMRSAARLSYQQMQAAIDGRTDDTTGPLLEPVLKPLWQAYEAVARARDRRAPLDLDLPERRIVFDDNGHVAGVVTPERLGSHRLIEEFMIQANVAAAETLEEKRSPLLYRVHEPPSKERVRALAEFLATLGLKLNLGEVLKPELFNRVLARAKGSENEHLINEVVLRAQAQAFYSPENLGHFGLNLRRYAHFTSPIRRYADLIVHRALIGALGLGEGELSDRDISLLHETAELISAAERRAMAAERDTVDRLVAAYLRDRVGASFTGRVAGVAGAGLFVELADTGADGFVPVATLGDDYFVYDPSHHSLTGERTGESFRIGDRVEVRLLEVSPLAGAILLEVLSTGVKRKATATRSGTRASANRHRNSRRSPRPAPKRPRGRKGA